MRPTIETSRLLLRPFALADASDVQRLAGAFAIADTTVNIPHPYLDGMAESWIGSHEEAFDSGRAIELAMIERASGALVGAIALTMIERGHQANLGYWVGEAWWGRGYATEASRELVRHAFDALGLARVHAHHFSRNPASGRVMQKIGMTHEGRQRSHVLVRGELEDIERYGVLRGELR